MNCISVTEVKVVAGRMGSKKEEGRKEKEIDHRLLGFESCLRDLLAVRWAGCLWVPESPSL